MSPHCSIVSNSLIGTIADGNVMSLGSSHIFIVVLLIVIAAGILHFIVSFREADI